MRKLLSFGVVVATAAALVAPVVQASPAAAAGTNTTVVLTFDDGVGNQAIAAAALKARNMHGTFYVNSNYIGTDSGFLSWAQLQQMQADGNEIGGHTLDHVDLTTLPVDQVEAQVCQDRQNIMSHGLTVTNFAYPFGAGYENATARQVIQECGYNSARRAWGLYSAAPECGTTGCNYPYADTIPPGDAYGVRTGDNPMTTMTLAQLQTEVTQAETHGGGLVPIAFHNICNGCDDYSITQANFETFLTWLQARAASGTVVQTMAQVIGGPVNPSDTFAPTTTIKCNNATCSPVGYTSTVSVTLAATDTGGSGVASIRYTTDGTDPTAASTAYSAPISVTSTKTVKYRAYDTVGNAEAVKTQLVTVDSTAPSSAASCNGAACVSGGWYSGNVQIGLSATDAGSGLKEIRYTTNGSDPTASSTLYGGPFAVASTATVKYRAYDNLNNAEAVKSQLVQIDRIAPSTELSCDGGACPASWSHASVTVTLTATDDGGSGVASIHYTTDGSVPTLASPLYTAPIAVASTQTLKFRAWDKAGNQEGAKAKTLSVDKAAPTAAIKCNNGTCSTAWIRGAVKVALSATDTGGWGVAGIHYTIDGKTPTVASPLYSGPITLSVTKTVKFAAFDQAANRSAIGSRQVKIDRTPPTVQVTAPKNHAAVKGSVRVSAKVSDAQSKIAKVLFYVDGRLVATDTSPTFSFVWNTSKAAKQQHTLTAKAVDKAGNSAAKSITVTVR